MSTNEFDSEEYPVGGPTLEDLTVMFYNLCGSVESSIGVCRIVNETLTIFVLLMLLSTQSPLSDVHSVTPQETLSASASVGEQGGFCGIQTGVGWVGVFSVRFGLVRRRQQ